MTRRTHVWELLEVADPQPWSLRQQRCQWCGLVQNFVAAGTVLGRSSGCWLPASRRCFPTSRRAVSAAEAKREALLRLPEVWASDGRAPHPSWGGWRSFLAGDCSLTNEVDGVFYFTAGRSSGYLVFPDGRLFAGSAAEFRPVLGLLRYRGRAFTLRTLIGADDGEAPGTQLVESAARVR